MHVKALPWQGFPGIFSSIDRYTKQVVISHLQQEGALPPWMAGVGDSVGHLDPPHWSRFQATDDSTGFTLRGEADAIFRLRDGTCVIIDYKTSRYNPGNRSQHRVYRAQLNAYAWIARRLDFPPVSGLALVYMEPSTGGDSVRPSESVFLEGFSMAFIPRVVEVDLDPGRLVPPLLRQAARIHAMVAPPDPRNGCRDCSALEGLLTALGR